MGRITWTKTPKENCVYCGAERRVSWMQRHVNACLLNPINIRKCVNCGDPVKQKGAITCSVSCHNTHFRSGVNHPNHKPHKYRTVCFHYHEKKCIICGEENIVEVHHYDHDKTNNDPGNLIPMCPTHHQYIHSRFKHLLIDKVEKYVKTGCGKV